MVVVYNCGVKTASQAHYLMVLICSFQKMYNPLSYSQDVENIILIKSGQCFEIIWFVSSYGNLPYYELTIFDDFSGILPDLMLRNSVLLYYLHAMFLVIIIRSCIAQYLNLQMQICWYIFCAIIVVTYLQDGKSDLFTM